MKAVVLETRNGEAAVLVNDGTVRIVRGVYNVGEIIDYRLRPRFVQWIAAAAAMLILVGGSTAMWIDRNYVTYAEVSLDVNPSIIYSLNKRDRVLDVRAVNDDAESIVKVLEQEGVRFTPLSEAVEKTMSILDNQGYMDESTDDYVLINVSADNEGRQKRLSDEVETAMTATLEQNHTIEYRIDHSDRKTAREADKAGMSAGRYAAWQRDEGASDVKDYADKPVRELMDRNPDEDQRDSEAKPAVAPTNDPQAQPSDEENGRLPPSPMQEEADTDAPSGVQTPVENPACDTPSSEKTPTDKPAASEPSDASPDTQGPTEKQATDSHPSTQEPVESDRVSPEQSGPEDAPSKERSESNPKQASSSNGDKRSDKSTPGSGQPDKPNNGANPSKSRGSEKSTSREADPGSKR
ncbi:MAG: hypothetical protein IKF99_17275 [Oscillospiraceae bacterium]|nr:hypothetical protein [Oscillospiraceae bacterium]